MRNEGLELLKLLVGFDDELCKMLGFQGIFETLIDICIEEDDIVIKDCLDLMT